MKTLALAMCLTLLCLIVSSVSPPKARANAGRSCQDEERIRELIEQLGNDDPARRQEAEDELRTLGEKARSELHEAATGEDPEVKARARSLLQSLELKKHLAGLRKPDLETRSAATEALIRLGDACASPVRELLGSPDEKLALRACYILMNVLSRRYEEEIFRIVPKKPVFGTDELAMFDLRVNPRKYQKETAPPGEWKVTILKDGVEMSVVGGSSPEACVGSDGTYVTLGTSSSEPGFSDVIATHGQLSAKAHVLFGDASLQCRYQLLSLTQFVTHHKRTRGAYPRSNCTELTDTQDPWGNAIIYRKTKEGFQLYSTGPDGKDDRQKGDDISW